MLFIMCRPSKKKKEVFLQRNARFKKLCVGAKKLHTLCAISSRNNNNLKLNMEHIVELPLLIDEI